MELFSKHLKSLKNFAITGPRSLVIVLIKIYQVALSPIFGGRCRFYPSCSQYSAECFEKHNIARATILTLNRLGQCHPFGRSGFDPVPEVK
jgi:uncharacterized protein